MDPSYLKSLIEKYPIREMPREKADAPTYIMTCPVQLQYVWLAKPRPPEKAEDTPLYECALIIPPQVDISLLKSNYVRLMAARFGADWATTLVKVDTEGKTVSAVTGGLKKQIAQHAKKVPGFADTGFYFDAKSKFQPEVIDRRKNKLDCANPELVYAGMWALANVKMYARPTKGAKNPGVSFQLEALQKIADDAPFFTKDKTKSFGEIEDDEITTHAGAMNGAAGPAKAPAASIPGFD